MTHFVTFPGYGPNTPEKTINLDLVYMWTGVDYNGNYGTEVYLTGVAKPVLLGVAEWDFAAVVKRELSPEEQK